MRNEAFSGAMFGNINCEYSFADFMLACLLINAYSVVLSSKILSCRSTDRQFDNSSSLLSGLSLSLYHGQGVTRQDASSWHWE